MTDNHEQGRVPAERPREDTELSAHIAQEDESDPPLIQELDPPPDAAAVVAHALFVHALNGPPSSVVRLPPGIDQPYMQTVAQASNLQHPNFWMIQQSQTLLELAMRPRDDSEMDSRFRNSKARRLTAG